MKLLILKFKAKVIEQFAKVYCKKKNKKQINK